MKEAYKILAAAAITATTLGTGCGEAPSAQAATPKQGENLMTEMRKGVGYSMTEEASSVRATKINRETKVSLPHETARGVQTIASDEQILAIEYYLNLSGFPVSESRGKVTKTGPIKELMVSTKDGLGLDLKAEPELTAETILTLKEGTRFYSSSVSFDKDEDDGKSVNWEVLATIKEEGEQGPDRFVFVPVMKGAESTVKPITPSNQL